MGADNFVGVLGISMKKLYWILIIAVLIIILCYILFFVNVGRTNVFLLIYSSLFKECYCYYCQWKCIETIYQIDEECPIPPQKNYDTCINSICVVENNECKTVINPDLYLSSCKGTAKCFNGTITKIIDGDTLEVDDVRIRLVLVDAPETNEVGGTEATDFVSTICPIGSTATVDEDDWQGLDKYGRLLAVVYCGDTNINAELIDRGYATTYQYFCDDSEFGNEEWAGCVITTSERVSDPGITILE